LLEDTNHKVILRSVNPDKKVATTTIKTIYEVLRKNLPRLKLSLQDVENIFELCYGWQEEYKARGEKWAGLPVAGDLTEDKALDVGTAMQNKFKEVELDPNSIDVE
jgi:hypothetical protein